MNTAQYFLSTARFCLEKRISMISSKEISTLQKQRFNYICLVGCGLNSTSSFCLHHNFFLKANVLFTLTSAIAPILNTSLASENALEKSPRIIRGAVLCDSLIAL